MLFVAMPRKESPLDSGFQVSLAVARSLSLTGEQASDNETLAEELAQLDASSLQAIVRQWPPLQTLLVFLRLCDHARLLANRGSEVAVSSAQATLSYARAAKSTALEGRVLADLRAEAWAAVANAHRVREDYPAAEAAWKRADAFLARGSNDPVLHGEIAERKAAFWRAKRAFSKARHCLRIAARQYRGANDRQRLGRVKLAEGRVYFHALDTRRALRAVLDAFDLLDPLQDPALVATCLHLVACCLVDGEEPEYALEWIDLLDLAYAEEGGSLELRASWLRGRLYARLKEWSGAERHLESVRKVFLARGLDYDAALAGVDLAMVYAERGQLSAVWLLAQEMYPVFLSNDIPREASAVLILFAQVAKQKRLDIERLAALAQQLEPIRRQHGR